MLALKFACTSDEVLHGVDCCRGRSGGGGGGGRGGTVQARNTEVYSLHADLSLLILPPKSN